MKKRMTENDELLKKINNIISQELRKQSEVFKEAQFIGEAWYDDKLDFNAMGYMINSKVGIVFVDVYYKIVKEKLHIMMLKDSQSEKSYLWIDCFKGLAIK